VRGCARDIFHRSPNSPLAWTSPAAIIRLIPDEMRAKPPPPDATLGINGGLRFANPLYGLRADFAWRANQ
jgi:hypothetical protein